MSVGVQSYFYPVALSMGKKVKGLFCNKIEVTNYIEIQTAQEMITNWVLQKIIRSKLNNKTTQM